MMITKRRLHYMIPICGVALCMVLFGGTRGGVRAPVDYAGEGWFRADADSSSAGVASRIVDASETVELFQARFRDRGSDARFHFRSMSTMPHATAPTMSQMGRPLDRDSAFEREIDDRRFTGQGEASARTGWGWLADDVQQLRGAGSPRSGGGEEAMFPRRMDDGNDGLISRRWLDE